MTQEPKKPASNFDISPELKADFDRRFRAYSPDELAKTVSEFEALYYAENSPTESQILPFMENHIGWIMLTEKIPLYQVWTAESVVLMAELLKGSQKILEVGCGDGTLSYRLSRLGIPIIASDSYESHNTRPRWPLEILKLNYKDAIAKIRPDTVVSCWMPYTEDWTPAFRACETVKKYILVGEGEDGCTGADESFKPHKGWRTKEYERIMGLAKSDFAWNGKIDFHRHTFAYITDRI